MGWELSCHYDLMVTAALERILSENQEAGSEWLSQATRALSRHRRIKNSREKSARPSTSFLSAAV